MKKVDPLESIDLAGINGLPNLEALDLRRTKATVACVTDL